MPVSILCDSLREFHFAFHHMRELYDVWDPVVWAKFDFDMEGKKSHSSGRETNCTMLDLWPLIIHPDLIINMKNTTV